MKDIKENKNTLQLSFDFKSEDRVCIKRNTQEGKIISIFSQKNIKKSFENKIFKDVINHSKSF